MPVRVRRTVTGVPRARQLHDQPARGGMWTWARGGLTSFDQQHRFKRRSQSILEDKRSAQWQCFPLNGEEENENRGFCFFLQAQKQNRRRIRRKSAQKVRAAATTAHNSWTLAAPVFCLLSIIITIYNGNPCMALTVHSSLLWVSVCSFRVLQLV